MVVPRGSRDLLRQYIREVLDDKAEKEQRRVQDRKLAACCLIFGEDRKVLAVSRKDDPTAFGLPGGKVDPGETPAEAAIRELAEETGLQAVSVEPVFVHDEADGYTTTTFLCEVAGTIFTFEAGKVRWVEPQVLFDGPFGGYNRRLWAHLGLDPR